MKYVVAVSGGVDSIVLLDMLTKKGEDIVVAHFDHGIRETSSADARFVEALAGKYGLAFEHSRVELGKHASEADAREKRYEFLHHIAKKYDGTIVTAHHQDDLIETISINLQRGTGWRGLAVLRSSKIVRPLLGYRKSELYDYALTHNLEWVEDETNASDTYLRNRLRRKLNSGLSDTSRMKVIKYWKKQLTLRSEIEAEEKSLIDDSSTFSRYFFTHIEEETAAELLRVSLKFAITRPQTTRLLHAIKTAKSGTTVEVGAGRTVRFTLRDFIVETP